MTEPDIDLKAISWTQRRLSQNAGRIVLLMLISISGVLVWALFSEIPRELKGGAVVLLMLILLMLRVPVGVAMALPGLVGLFAIAGWTAVTRHLAQAPFATSASWSLSVIPMFVLMGLVLWRAGVTERIYDSARIWLRWLPGGLAVTTNFAGAGLAAASGSTIGITYAVGRIGIPEMLRAGYDPRIATGSVLMAGTGGQLIPPSILLVIFAGVAQVPVGPQLLAGLIPGVLLALFYGLLIVGSCLVRPSLAPRSTDTSVTWSERLKAAVAIWPIPALTTVVLGGLYMGVFTATEAGAFGALCAIFIGFYYVRSREYWNLLRLALRDTIVSVGSIFFLLIGAAVLNRTLAISGLATWFAQTLQEAGLGRMGFLLIVLVIYLLLGLFMEPIAMILLTVPALMPAVMAMDISLLWFGVFVVLLGELAILTPPVGILSFVVHKITQHESISSIQEIPLTTIFAGALWFLPASIVLLLLLMWFPELALWLPNRGG